MGEPTAARREPIVAVPERRRRLPSEQQAHFDGYVPIVVQQKKHVDEPALQDSKTKHEGVLAGATKTESGTLEKDSLALHLSDGTKANNLVKLRTFFRVEDKNGVCQLAYAGAVKAP